MQLIVFTVVSLGASIVGGICGVGGGIVIKPVLDATHIASIATISFLSACTVLCMSTTTVIRNRKKKGLLDYRTSTSLAIGAVVGGFLGKWLFNALNEAIGGDFLGGIQSALLFVVLALTLVYSFLRKRITTHNITQIAFIVFIGIILGGISAFLGIGGGPIELMALSFLFSMGVKKAAANSLYIIMFSQIAAIVQTIVTGALPPFGILLLICVCAAGVVGGLIGSTISKRISAKHVEFLYRGLLIVVLAICAINVIEYTGI